MHTRLVQFGMVSAAGYSLYVTFPETEIDITLYELGHDKSYAKLSCRAHPAYSLLRYSQIAKGMKTMSMTAIQASASHAYVAVCCGLGETRRSARTTFTVIVTGFHFAKCCNQSGIDSTGTKTALAKTSGNTQMNPATCAVSVFLTTMPMQAETQEKAKPNRSRIAIAAIASERVPSSRKPIR